MVTIKLVVQVLEFLWLEGVETPGQFRQLCPRTVKYSGIGT